MGRTDDRDARAAARRERVRRARRRAGLVGGLRRRRAGDPADADVVDRALAPLEGADPLPGASLPGRDLRRTRKRSAPTGPLTEAAYADAEIVADAVAVLDAAGVEQARGRRDVVRRALRAGARRRRTRTACAASSRSRRRCRSLTPPHPWRAEHDFDARARDRRGLGEGQPPLLAARLPRLPRVLLLARSSTSRTRPSRSRTRWPGAWTLAGDPARSPSATSATRTRRAPRRCAAASRAPVLVIHGDADRITPFERGARVAELTGGRLVTLEGAGHAPQARDPVRVNRLIREFADQRPAGRPRPRRRAGSAGGRGRAGRCTCPRRSGSATRGATSRSPMSCAAASPTWRSSGWRSRRSRRVLERRGETIHPASAELASESGHFDREAGEHELQRVPGAAADGRDPVRELHGLPRRRQRGRRSICGSATRRGTSTTSSTRTPS